MQINKNLVIGLDTGTSSIGWILIDIENHKIIASGVRISPTKKDGKSNKHPNQKRREKRLMRRQLHRKRLRKDLLIKCLQKHGMFPKTEETLHKLLGSLQKQRKEEHKKPYHQRNEELEKPSPLEIFLAYKPYTLRQRAATGEKLTLLELGRALYHMAQRRGFPQDSLRFQDNEKDAQTLKLGNIEDLQIGANTTQDAIKKAGQAGSPYTLGAYLATLHPADGALCVVHDDTLGNQRIRARYTYRKMYEKEYETIWHKQAIHYPHILTKDLKEKIRHILFHQRPLKPQKRGKCPFEPNSPRIYKAHPLAETLHLYQFLNQLKINGEPIRPDTDHWHTVLNFASENQVIEIPALKKDLQKHNLFQEDDMLNYHDDQEINSTPTLIALRKAWGPVWDTLPQADQLTIWQAILVKNTEQVKQLAHQHHAQLHHTTLNTLTQRHGKEAKATTKITKRTKSPMVEIANFQTYLNQLRFDENPLTDVQREKIIALVYHQKTAVTIPHIKKALNLPTATCNKFDKEKLPPLTSTKLMQQLLGSVWDTLAPRKDHPTPYHYTLSPTQEAYWHTIFTATTSTTLKKSSAKWGFDRPLYGSNGYQARYQVLKKLAKSLKTTTANLSQKALQYIIPHLHQGHTYDKAVMLGGLQKLIHQTPQIPDQDAQTLHTYLINLLKTSSTQKETHFDQLKTHLRDKYHLSDKQLQSLWHHSQKNKKNPESFPAPEEAKIHLTPPSNNPTVSTATFETSYLLQDILHTHKIYPGALHIELARDLKAPAQAKDTKKTTNTANKKAKDKASRKLLEAGCNPTDRNILKYRLWEECNKQCIYTGDSIGFDALFKHHLFDIEHIVPYSISFDNSFFNKTLCKVSENRQVKQQQTPWQAYRHDAKKWEAIKQRAKDSKFSKAKYQHFIQEGAPKALEIYAPREATNTSYIARHLAQELKAHLPSTIHTVQGRATAVLRRHWDLDDLLNQPIPLTTNQPGYHFLALDKEGEVQASEPWAHPVRLLIEDTADNPQYKQNDKETLEKLRNKAFNAFQKKAVPAATLIKEKGGAKTYGTRYHCLQSYVKLHRKERICTPLPHPNNPNHNIAGLPSQPIYITTHQPGYHFLTLDTEGHVQYHKHWSPPAIATPDTPDAEAIKQQRLDDLRNQEFEIFVKEQKAYQANNPDKPRHAHYLQGQVTLEKTERLCYPEPRKNRADHRHHLIDAAIVATTSPHTISKLSHLAQQDRLYKADLEEKLPWPTFKQDLQAHLDQCLISHYTRKDIFTLAPNKKGQHKKEVKKHPKAHGQLHKDTIYGGGKLTEKKKDERLLYLRKPIDGLTPSEIDDIADTTIKHMLLGRLVKALAPKEYDTLPLTKNSLPDRDKIQEAWEKVKKSNSKKEIEEALKNIIWKDTYKKKIDEYGEVQRDKNGEMYDHVGRTPQFLLPVKRGEHKGQYIPIKRIRIHKREATAVPLDEMEKKWVLPGNNEAFALYETQDGKWFAKGYTFWDAVEYMKEHDQTGAFTPPANAIDEKDGKEGNLKLTLRKDNYYLLGLTKSEIADLRHQLDAGQPIDYKNQVSDYLYRCQKITKGDFYFRKHLAATIDNPLEFIYAGVKTLKKLNPVQVTIGRLGQLEKIHTTKA